MFEYNYINLMEHILSEGERKMTRNGPTRSIFAQSLHFDSRHLPLLHSRRTYWQGIAGEYAAFLRCPESVDDFRKWGCNYWDDWGDDDGHLVLDYGNEWEDQIYPVIYGIKNDPHGRRHLIDAWNFRHLDDLSLPCCHYSYQFYVRENKYLDLLWNQRSADLCVGVPADAVLAAIMLKTFAQHTGYESGYVTMSLGDVHIYENHVDNAYKQVDIFGNLDEVPVLDWDIDKRETLFDFEPTDVKLNTPYIPQGPIKYELNI